METIAKHRYARTSAQKARLVADLIRGKKVAQALENLNFTNKKAAALVKKVFRISYCKTQSTMTVQISMILKLLKSSLTKVLA